MSHPENYLGIDDVPHQESTFLRICTQSFAKMNPAVRRLIPKSSQLPRERLYLHRLILQYLLGHLNAPATSETIFCAL
jgi:hypothetical protein